MITRLAKKYNIDLTTSYMVGDRHEDMEAGKNAGTATILVGERENNLRYADMVFPDLIDRQVYGIPYHGMAVPFHYQNRSMSEFLIAILAIFGTFAIYHIALWVHRTWNYSLTAPVLVATILMQPINQRQ